MSKKTSVYFPSYQLRRGEDPARPREILFRHSGIFFTMKIPLFGATETQKAALKWAANNTPPVICVKHETPISPDKEGFADPSEFHRTYYPYAMTIATIECLGENTPRKIKIYFCNTVLREKGVYVESKDTFIAPVL